jgi:hypothetical protein
LVIEHRAEKRTSNQLQGSEVEPRQSDVARDRLRHRVKGRFTPEEISVFSFCPYWGAVFTT